MSTMEPQDPEQARGATEAPSTGSLVSFLHDGALPALCFRQRSERAEASHIVILRVTYDLGPDGTLTKKAKQPAVNFREQTFDGSFDSPLRHETHLAPEKRNVDVIVHAEAHAPRDVPTARFDVALAVRERDAAGGTPGLLLLRSQLAVTGPRSFRRSSITGGFVLGEPEPTLKVPLRFDHAAGGTIRLDELEPGGRPLLLADPRNPVGRGIIPTPEAVERDCRVTRSDAVELCRRWAKRNPTLPGPQVEYADDGRNGRPDPEAPPGWGIVAKHWQSRYRYAGTFDDAWRRDRHPLLPTDFDIRFWNGAHPDLQLPRLPTDAMIELLNCVPTSRASHQALRIALPGLEARVTHHDVEVGVPRTSPMRLDTVIVDLLGDEVTLLYRAEIPDRRYLAFIRLDVDS